MSVATREESHLPSFARDRTNSAAILHESSHFESLRRINYGLSEGSGSNIILLKKQTSDEESPYPWPLDQALWQRQQRFLGCTFVAFEEGD